MLFIGVIAGLATLAQTRYFVQGEGNLSIIPKADYNARYANEFSSVPSYTDMKADLEFDARLGFGLKAGARFTIAPKWFLDGQLSYSQVRYRQSNAVSGVTVTGNSISQFTMNYFGVGYVQPGMYDYGTPGWTPGPVLPAPNQEQLDWSDVGKASLGFLGAEMSVKRTVAPGLLVGLGGSLNYLLSAGFYNPEYDVLMQPGPGPGPSYAQVSIEKSRNRDMFTEFGGSVHVNAEYQFTEHWAIEVNARQFVNRLYEKGNMYEDGKSARLRMLALGVKYFLK